MAENNPGSSEAVKDAVKRKLNADKVKLWLPPYTSEDGTLGSYPEGFVAEYCSALRLPESLVLEALEELRQHALSKLESRKQFQETGVATLKVRLPASIQNQQKTFEISMKLDLNADRLREKIADEIQLTKDHLKLIANGRVLETERPLRDQGLADHSHVMVVLLSKSEREARRQEESVTAIQKAKDAATLLSNKKYGEGPSEDKFLLQITDQNGKRLALPDEERAALSVALTLNEKGRTCLKKKDYATALVFLLESEAAFRCCRSTILDAVDNFAILCLDIVWCYLCLQNIDQLPNAGDKLRICEESFRRTHGPNMERLQTIKGDKGKDLALYVKLYLLQGILAYFQANHFESRRLLEKSENLLKSVQVDETKLMQLVAMGYEVPQARLGLRAAGGNVSGAITKISERRERKTKLADQEREESRKAKLAQRLGKSANGEWIKVDVYEQLVAMGFPSGVTREAMRQTNSDLQQALEAIQNHPEWYDIPDVSTEDTGEDWQGKITDEMLAQMVEMGFDPSAARQVLMRLRGDVEKAVQELMKRGSQLPSTSAGTEIKKKPKADGSTEAATEGDNICPSDSTLSESDTQYSSTEELTRDEKDAMAELAPDIPEYDEDYLDITLDEEAQYLEEYKMRLASVASTTH